MKLEGCSIVSLKFHRGKQVYYALCSMKHPIISEKSLHYEFLIMYLDLCDDRQYNIKSRMWQLI
jgi:hypothetical protein